MKESWSLGGKLPIIGTMQLGWNAELIQVGVGIGVADVRLGSDISKAE